MIIKSGTSERRKAGIFCFKILDLRCFTGSMAKERISKRVFQESKARRIFRKSDISYPLIRTVICPFALLSTFSGGPRYASV